MIRDRPKLSGSMSTINEAVEPSPDGSHDPGTLPKELLVKQFSSDKFKPRAKRGRVTRRPI